jgi:hypothetical protein
MSKELDCERLTDSENEGDEGERPEDVGHSVGLIWRLDEVLRNTEFSVAACSS